MRYILVTDSNNKVLVFREDKQNLLIKFLNSNSVKIDEGNYFTEEEFDKFSLYRHIANADKTDEQFEEYKRMAERVGLNKLDRNSKIRPLHEK